MSEDNLQRGRNRGMIGLKKPQKVMMVVYPVHYQIQCGWGSAALLT